jgi:shikimate kinase
MPPPKHLALIGLRCSGKTSVGTELARILHLPFVDLDREIEHLHARTIAERASDTRERNAPTSNAHAREITEHNARSSTTRSKSPRPNDPTPPLHPTRSPNSPTPTAGEILQSQGEPAFRALESKALTEILRREPRCVLATGGGVVEREENRRALAEHAVCIWLRVDPAELARRLRADPTPRPSLTGEDPASEIPKLARRRDPFYAALAQTTLDGTRLPPAALAEELARELCARSDLELQD